MLEAFGLGAAAQASLLLAGLAVFWIAVPRQIVGILAGIGAGGMIAAVSFDLVPEAERLANWQFAQWMLAGVGIFLLGDWAVDKRFGDTGAGGALGIVVGSVVDGVPESLIFGIQVGTAFPIGVSFLAAVFISNIPQAPCALRRPCVGWLGQTAARIAVAQHRHRVWVRGCARLSHHRREQCRDR